MDNKQNLPLRLGVGIILLNKENKVFVGRRLDNPLKFWQMPQGGIERDENLEEAAFRELNEETSLTKSTVDILAISKRWIKYDLPDSLIPQLWNGSYRGQKQKWFLFKFRGPDNQININTQTPEFSNWRWSSKEELIKSIVPFKLKVYKKVVKEFSIFL